MVGVVGQQCGPGILGETLEWRTIEGDSPVLKR